ncbi:hypothetical protein [Vibrio splendidus]|uniref:hypothetical protein n=1 Tax=Vibrio splendidus TaxID=29497 RepID=UPI000D378974|nr:hypothetical protein [Vibrio splendidus]PTO70140.1 hypothetical protein CWN96_04400 [Vibrio splendidus]PTP78652.1 hypothetical protein CWO06_05385 [Vibrio splendidus]PTP82397.1 hypothetical protein CWO02_23400 [Vibrio splendidus]
MSALQAIPTQHGIDVLNSELKNTVTKYRLIGALTHDAPSESLYSFYENTIETSYYDDNGVLTFILNLPIEQHFDEYLHQIDVLDSANQAVIECSTPKVALPKGIGGMVTLKASISGEAGEVIFKHGEFVTETELLEVHLTQYMRAEDFVGLIVPDSTVVPMRDKAFLADGSDYAIADYPKLISRVQGTPIMVAQALIDADPEEYAANYGISADGLRFTVPNYPLRPHLAAAGVFGAVGSTVEDQIQNITGGVTSGAGALSNTEGTSVNGSGALRTNLITNTGNNVQATRSSFDFDFDASRVARTSTYTEVNSSFLNFYIIHGESA